MMESDSVAPQEIDLLITGGFVLVLDDKATFHYPGSVAVSDGRILAVGESADIDPAYAAIENLDASDHVVMPGLINVHGHASNSLIRGLGKDQTLHEWLENVCWPCMDSAEDEDLYNGVLLSCLEMLLNGVTTFCDMWPGVGLAAEAVKQSGQRAMLAHNIKDFGDPTRGEKELATALDARSEWNGYADGRVMVGIGPHSVYTCQHELLAACAEAARADGIHVQMHACETAHEVELSQAQHGRSPIQLMADVGLLGPSTIVAHAVHVTETDIRLLQESESSVAHNISSNLILASGIAPVHRYLEEGIRVGLGTDGPGSNDGLDLLRDLKLAALTQKVNAGDPTSMAVENALAMVTRRGAEAIGIDDEVGTLEVGKQADIILVDFDKPHFTPRHFDHTPNIMSHLVYCAGGSDVDTAIVNGRILISEGRPFFLDILSINEKAQQSSRKVVRASRLLDRQ